MKKLTVKGSSARSLSGMKMKIKAHVFVSGRVQGVFFRSETRYEANRKNVKGWVRNLSDGRVEAVFEGERNDVEKLIEYCRRGPSGANVTKVQVFWEETSGQFKDFKIRYRSYF